jgi:hypothetical protein
MADLKTYQTNADVSAFLDRVPDARRREDARTMAALMQRLTGAEPRMWGSSIVGFGTYTYFYESGRSGDWPLVGFAPRAKELVLYIMSGFDEHAELMRGLGRYKTGKSCLYVRTLDDIQLPVLTRLIEMSIARMVQRYGDDAPAAKSKAKPKAKPKVKAKPKSTARPKAKAGPAAKAGAKPRTTPRAVAKPKAKAAARTRPKPKPKPATRPSARKRGAATRR